MAAAFTVEDLRAAAAAKAATEQMNAQDGKMDDGDLGITVSSGYSEIEKEAPGMPSDLGQAFMACAKAF